MKMTNGQALEIANEFLKDMNPEMWDGEGDVPDTFDKRVWVKNNISPHLPGQEMDISFEYDEEDGWGHLVELVDSELNETMELLSGYGVDSPQNIADTICCLLEGVGEEV